MLPILSAYLLPVAIAAVLAWLRARAVARSGGRPLPFSADRLPLIGYFAAGLLLIAGLAAGVGTRGDTTNSPLWILFLGWAMGVIILVGSRSEKKKGPKA